MFWENSNTIETWLIQLLSLAWITLGRESLLCKHIHTLYTCSHCFIEHLGSISHFKNFGNSTTSVGRGFVCLLDSSSQIGGTLNCWCSIHGYHLWSQRAELAHGYRDVAMWGVVLDNVNVCVSELEGIEAMLRSAAHQLWQINTGTHTRAHQMFFFCLYPRKAVPVTHTCSIHMTGANLILGLSRNRLLS